MFYKILIYCQYKINCSFEISNTAITFYFFPHSVITLLITRMRHGKERGHNAKEWEEIWHQFPQKMCKVCFMIEIIYFLEYYISEKCVLCIFHENLYICWFKTWATWLKSLAH